MFVVHRLMAFRQVIQFLLLFSTSTEVCGIFPIRTIAVGGLLKRQIISFSVAPNVMSELSLQKIDEKA